MCWDFENGECGMWTGETRETDFCGAWSFAFGDFNLERKESKL